MQNKLYPLSFEPAQLSYNWGGSHLLLADLGYVDSKINNGYLAGNTISEILETYMDRLVGEGVLYHWGRQFPYMVQILDIVGSTPVMVCPSNEVAAERFDAPGKDKYWLILEADSEASVAVGFKKEISASDFYTSAVEGNLGSLLNSIHPKAGEVYHIAPGTAHRAKGKIRILELSQSSAIDFLLEGGEAAESASQVLDFVKLTAEQVAAFKLPGGDAFTITERSIAGGRTSALSLGEGCAVVVCISGALTSCEGEGPVGSGGILLVPYECEQVSLEAGPDGAQIVIITPSEDDMTMPSYYEQDDE